MSTTTPVPCDVMGMSSPYAGMPTEITVRAEGHAHPSLYLANDEELDDLQAAMLDPSAYRYLVRADLLIPFATVRALADVTARRATDRHVPEEENQ